ncbi:MAG: response regulator [Chloroflexota bacterium]
MKPQTSTPFNYADYNILIVDDTPTNLAVLVEYLQTYGFGIRVARSGETALQRVAYDAPDMILLDILMPGIDGFETCRQLKANAQTSTIPIIFMTSLTSAEDKVRGFELGAVDYVTKPLQQAEVLARITTHLQQHELTHRTQTEKERLFEAVNQQRTQLRQLTAKLTEVQEQERRELARELHDEMGQALTAVRMNLASIENALPAEYTSPTHAVGERLQEAAVLTDHTLEQIRELALNLRPPMLDDLGLGPTLRWYIKQFAARMDVEATFDIQGLDDTIGQRLEPSIETTLYRVVQEALTNISRHANANKVEIQLICDDTSVNVAVQDDGRGFDMSQRNGRQTPGMGLLGMHERVTLLGGTFEIVSERGKGTQIGLSIPKSNTHEQN